MAKIELVTPEGAPVQVETGLGRVVSVVEKGTRNAQVTITAEHLRQPVTGWVDKQGPMWPRVQWAHQHGAKVWYRVDLKRHRTAEEPITTPLAQLDRMSKTRDVVRIERPENAPMDTTIGLDPMADVAPAAVAPTPPAAQTQRPLQADGRRADAGGVVGVASVVSTPAPPPATATDGHGPRPAPPVTPQGGAPSPQTSAAPTDPPSGGQPANPSPRPQSSPPIPGPALTPVMLEALHDVVQAVTSHAEKAWVDDCCNSAVQAGCTREQVLHVLHRAGQGWDVGLQPLPRMDRSGPAVERQALDRARDPDRVAQRAPAPPQGRPGAHEGQPVRQQGQRPQMGARSGHTRAALPIAGDERPWTPFNTDGRPNLSSYGFGAVMEMTTLALKLRVNRTRARHAEDPSVSLEPPTDREVHELAATLLYLADRTQFEARADGQSVGRVDRMAASHKVARQAVREGIDLFPLPWGEDAAAWEAWRDTVVSASTTLLRIATGLYVGVERDEGGAPQVEVPPADPDSR